MDSKIELKLLKANNFKKKLRKKKKFKNSKTKKKLYISIFLFIFILLLILLFILFKSFFSKRKTTLYFQDDLTLVSAYYRIKS